MQLLRIYHLLMKKTRVLLSDFGNKNHWKIVIVPRINFDPLTKLHRRGGATSLTFSQVSKLSVSAVWSIPINPMECYE